MSDDSPLVTYLPVSAASAELAAQARSLGVSEFARVRNLGYVFAPEALYPLAPHQPLPRERIVAFAVDMDGTSTTTEPLALHALEYMVRRCTGRLDPSVWPGLDPVRDHPYVIGNSNYRHVEFLMERYRDALDLSELGKTFCEALLWTLANMEDPERRRQIEQDARHCGLADLLANEEFQRLVTAGPCADEDVPRLAEPFFSRFGGAFHCPHQDVLVSAALDIYYMRYHAILRAIAAGQWQRLARELPTEKGRLVAPMPGYGIFLALIKGWLGEEAERLYPLLREEWPQEPAPADPVGPGRLRRLGTRFAREPARLALVTASIAFEARAVTKEVIRVVREEAVDWPVSKACRERLDERLADYRSVFDGFVNASDAHEARLKPHPDLYSIALYQMSVARRDYAYCVGLEDSEPGIVALRAAGIGCAVAMPNRDTRRQNYAAATKVVTGGLPELILRYNLLLDDRE